MRRESIILSIAISALLTSISFAKQTGCQKVKTTLQQSCSKLNKRKHGWSKEECLTYISSKERYFDRIGVKMCTEHFSSFVGENRRPVTKQRRDISKGLQRCLKEIEGKSFSTDDYEKCAYHLSKSNTLKRVSRGESAKIMKPIIAKCSKVRLKSCYLKLRRGLRKQGLILGSTRYFNGIHHVYDIVPVYRAKPIPVAFNCIRSKGVNLEKELRVEKICKRCEKSGTNIYASLRKMAYELIIKTTCLNPNKSRYDLFAGASSRAKFIKMFLGSTKHLSGWSRIIRIQEKLAAFMPDFYSFDPKECGFDLGRFLSKIGAKPPHGVSKRRSNYPIGGYPHLLSQSFATGEQIKKMIDGPIVKIDSKGVLHYRKLKRRSDVVDGTLQLKPGMMLHSVKGKGKFVRTGKHKGKFKLRRGHWIMYLGIIDGKPYYLDGINGIVNFNSRMRDSYTIDKVIDPF